MPTATEASLKDLHNQLRRAKDRELADHGAANADIAEKKAAYETWLKPQTEYHAAREAAAAQGRKNFGNVEGAEGNLRRLFAPHVDDVRRRYVAESEKTMAAFPSYGNTSNAVELNARLKIIREKIAKLDSLHLDPTVTDPAAGVRAIVESNPLSPLEGAL